MIDQAHGAAGRLGTRKSVMFQRPKILLLSALLVAALVSWSLGHVPSGSLGNGQGVPGSLIDRYAYYYDVLIGIGISVILAAGLNLVNGYTGQFSLGHAGFMAVGAYASSFLTL